jgi:hypothetical protein
MAPTCLAEKTPKILGGRLVVDGRNEAMMANWLWMMLDRKNNEHTVESVSIQKGEMISREKGKTHDLWICVFRFFR